MSEEERGAGVNEQHVAVATNSPCLCIYTVISPVLFSDVGKIIWLNSIV